jgi:hypothetical protein
MTATRFFTVLGGCACSLLVLAAIGARSLWHFQHDIVVWVMLASAPVYALAAWLIWRHTSPLSAGAQRHALLIILATAALARLALLFAPPLSTDIYRYVWDGRVQAAGINPYRYRPADPHLVFLRDATIYPNINRKATALTIYPPAAQLLFFSVTRLADSVTGMKAAMVGFELLTVAMLLALLRSRNLPLTRVLLYAWHPLPLFEFAGSGHIDAAAIALMMLACWLAQRRQALEAGLALGVAVTAKFFPLVIAPALYRRWGWRLPVAAALVVIAFYLPYLGVGSQVLGFLPGYVQEEGLANGKGFFVLSAIDALTPLPARSTALYVLTGAMALAIIAWRAVMRPDRTAVSLGGALTLLTAFTLWVSPHLPWYFTWMLPFLCFRLSWALLYLSAAAPLLYAIVWAPGALALDATLYLPCALILALEVWFNWRRLHPESTNDGTLRSRHAG